MKAARDIMMLATGFVVVLIDQYAKFLIRRNLLFGESQLMIPGFFNLSHLRNTGAVWGILRQQNAWLVLLSLLMLILIAIFHRRLTGDRLIYSFAIGCMVGGIVGNLIDRIKQGWVTDFLDFHWSASHWPCFNIADSAICVGVAIYIVSSLLAENGFDHGGENQKCTDP